MTCAVPVLVMAHGRGRASWRAVFCAAGLCHFGPICCLENRWGWAGLGCDL